MLADILVIILSVFAASYLVAGILSIRTIKRYGDIGVELDAGTISRSILQPSVSIVVSLDLNREDVVGKLDKLLHLHYRNYDVIAICNSAQNHAEFERVIARFKLKYDPQTRLYTTGEETYKRLTVADITLRRRRWIMEYGRSISTKRYILPLYDIDHRLHPDVLTRPAILLMSDPANRKCRFTGVYRHVIEENRRIRRFAAYADLNNLRRTYLSGNVCDRHNMLGLKMYPRVESPGEVSQFIPEPMMFVDKPDRMGTYLDVMASGMRDTRVCRLLYNVSELFISALFVFSVVMWLFYRGGDHVDYAMLAIASFLLVLLSSNFAIYILEMIAPEKIDRRRLGYVLLIAVPEALLSVSLTVFAMLRRAILSLRKEIR